MEQSGHKGSISVHASEEVRDGHAVHIARAALRASHADHAGQCLRHDVITGFLRIGAALSKCGNRAVDQFRVELVHLLIAQAKPIHDSGTEALNEDVRLRNQFLANFNRAGILQIHGDGFLAAIDPAGGKTNTVNIGSILTAGSAVTGLHLDNGRTVVSRNRACVGAGNIDAKINNFYAFQHFHKTYLLKILLFLLSRFLRNSEILMKSLRWSSPGGKRILPRYGYDQHSRNRRWHPAFRFYLEALRTSHYWDGRRPQ